MSNKANYEVTFQYDFDEENPSKFGDGRIKRVMAAHEGQFVSVFDDYGMKDMSFNIDTTLETLKTVMETVLKDAERSGIRMAVFAKKTSNHIIFNLGQVANKEEVLETLENKKEDFSFKKVSPSPYNNNDFYLDLPYGVTAQEELVKVTPLLQSVNAKDIALHIMSVDAMQMDNYTNRKKNSLDY